MRSTPTETASIRLVLMNPRPFRYENTATITRIRPAKSVAVLLSMGHCIRCSWDLPRRGNVTYENLRDRPKPVGSNHVLAVCARGHRTGTGWHLPKLLKNAWIPPIFLHLVFHHFQGFRPREGALVRPLGREGIVHVHDLQDPSRY